MRFYIRHTHDFPHFNLYVNYRARPQKDFYSADTSGLIKYKVNRDILVLIFTYKDDMR